jgi:hypothetical protein
VRCLHCGLCVFDLLRCGNDPFYDRRRITLVGALQSDGNQRAGLQVHRMLGLWAKCVRPSFIFAIFASASHGCFQSWFEVFFLRLRSGRARSARVGVAIPDACARPVKNS